jgi:hypothetical protein
MFTAALFTIAMEISYGNSQDTPLPTNGLKKMWCLYTQWNFSHKEQNFVICR